MLNEVKHLRVNSENHLRADAAKSVAANWFPGLKMPAIEMFKGRNRYYCCGGVQSLSRDIGHKLEKNDKG
jgi:iron-sulfur cluster repair protein YtfE (RIC family)